jgi:cysteine synthase A
MQIASSLLEAIGNTPLIRLKRASEETGCTILGKAEFANPGQSVKDRAALYLIRDALARGAVTEGGTVVEGTAGNTGIGLTVVGNVLGLKTIIVMPDTQSEEKKAAIRLLGATLVEVPAVPFANPNNYVHYSRRLAETLAASSTNGAFWANQFDNMANCDGHAAVTAPEIWNQLDGNIDGFVASVGTGGTLAGTARGLREKSSTIRIALADPYGASLFHYYTQGELRAQGSSITEGIGQSRITRNLEGFTPDVSYRIADEAAVSIVHRLVVEEGLCVGASSGINIAGAIALAKDLGPGKTIVTILCDHGTRYASKVFNADFLRSKGLPVPHWLDGELAPPPQVYAT